jgi:ABC-2 type transport system ATP-binding protein
LRYEAWDVTSSGEAAITCEELSVRFGSTLAVDGLSFEVPRCSLFGLLGPNGAGKSTTVAVLCTLLRPSSGRAQVAGFDVMRAPDEVRSRIGVLFQDPSLDDRLTGLENLKLHALVYGVPRALRKQRIEEAIALTDLGDSLNKLVRTYSGGMRRRLELSRVLLHAPQVLFLDEPTVGLDPQTRRAFWARIDEIRKQRGMTVFLTTHYLEELEPADMVAIVDHGRIMTQGSPAELKARLPPELAQGRPALEDVFVHWTGGAIRPDGASSRDQARDAVQRRGRLR